MTLKIHGQYSKVLFVKLIKTIEIEKISFEGKEFTEQKQITELCNQHFVSIGDKLPKVYNPVMSYLQLPILKQPQ